MKPALWRYLVFTTISFLVLAAPCVSCRKLTDSLSGTERVLVTLPEPLPALRQCASARRASYTLRWYDSGGNVQERAGVADQAEITLEAGFFTPVLAIPETGGTGIPEEALPVAGAIYPVHAEISNAGIVLEATFIRGIGSTCAELACTRSRGGFAVGRQIAEHFNWAKFDAAVQGKAQPFLVNRSLAADAILSGKVTVYDIRETETIEAALDGIEGVTAGALFLPAWPGSEGSIVPDDGTFSLEVPLGLSRWFSPDGILTVNAESGGVVCAYFEPYILRE
mgnify:CR=1 FL=1